VNRRSLAHATGGLAVLLSATLLAGCSSDGDQPSAHATASSPTASPTTPAFNPCAGVDAAAVSRALGTALRKETGTADNPRCALLPVEKGGPTFSLSYLWFDQGLEAAWSTMQVPTGTVSRPRITGADDARLVVNDSRSAYAVSAFLQNGRLIQTVNALALPPYGGPKVLRATKVLLGQLSSAAPSSPSS
jgi:hypothetical protein